MPDPLLPLLDANLIESIREFARWQKGGEVVERDGVLLVAGTTRFPVVSNAAVRLDSRIAVSEFYDRARNYFAGRKRGYTIWIRPDVDEDIESAGLDRGFRKISSSPWMVLDAPIAEQPLPEGLDIREVADEKGVRDACAVNREAYTSIDMPASEVDAIYGQPHRALNPRVRTFVGYCENKPVVTAMLLFTPQVAGVYWVGTVESVRGRGYAAGLTRVVSNAGFEAGASTLSLQASVMGEAIYTRLGYRTVGSQKWLLSPKMQNS